MPFSTYEHDEARKITLYRSKQAAQPSSKLGRAVARKLDLAAKRAHVVPGADRVLELANAAYDQAVKGVAKALTRSSALSLGQRAHWRRYGKHGHPITSWADIRQLDLEVIDKVRPRGLTHRYALGTGIEGAAGGLLMGGGTIVAAGGAIAGAGAAAAPGVGIAAGVFAADTATTLVASTRLTLQIGSFYGYDPADEIEQLYASAILNLGTASTAATKNAAFLDLYKLTTMLAKNKAWIELNKSVLTKLVRPVFRALTERLVKAKLGQIVPIAGVAVGFGMNYAMLDHVGTTAHWAYRERLLRDRGYPFQEPAGQVAGQPENEDEVVISIVDLAQDEGLTLPPD